MESTKPFISSLRVTLWIYRCFGIWREDNQSAWYRTYRWVFTIPFLHVYLLSMFIGAFHQKSSEQLWKDDLFIMLTEFAMLIKSATTFYNFKEIFKLLKMSVSKHFSPLYERHQNRTLNQILMSYLTISLLTSFTTSMHIFQGKYKLPTFSWFFGIPYGPDHPLNYYLIANYQVFGIIVHCMLNVAGDIQIAYMLATVGIQLEQLEQSLVSLSQITFKNNRRREFYRCTTQYQRINRFAQNVERIYSAPVFVQFCVSGITMCATAFRLSSISFTPDNQPLIIATVLYLCSMMVEIFLPCYYGNEIIRKSQRLTNALYSCEWYKLDRNFRRHILLLMTLTNAKTMTLRAGCFFRYNLQLFTTTLNSAYSLFAVLQRTLRYQDNA